MKNLRKIKLALTVGLMNEASEKNVLNSIKNMLKKFSADLGNFIDSKITKQLSLNAALENRTVAIRYENAVLNVNLVTNRNTRSQYIQGFDLR